MSTKTSRKLINILTIIITIILIILSIYWYKLGIFTSQEKMKAYLANKQIIGPLIFTLIQIIQVVIPIIPGGVSLLGGVILLRWNLYRIYYFIFPSKTLRQTIYFAFSFRKNL